MVIPSVFWKVFQIEFSYAGLRSRMDLSAASEMAWRGANDGDIQKKLVADLCSGERVDDRVRV
jgi:hypothetical protein